MNRRQALDTLAFLLNTFAALRGLEAVGIDLIGDPAGAMQKVRLGVHVSMLDIGDL